MIKTKHTSGEWKANEPLDMEGMHHIFIEADGKILGRIDGYVNGSLCGEKGHPDRKQTIANARLITAAPEMLAALENLENDANQMPMSIWQAVQEAIAKAKGSDA